MATQKIDPKADAIDGEVVSSEIVLRERQSESLVLTPVMDIAVAKKRLAEFQEFVRGYLVEGEDFGIIPGTQKPTLFKAGADKLCELYGLADDYVLLTKIEDFAAEPALFDYTIKCSLTYRGRMVANGLGSCSSYEGKYKFREQQRTCPTCGKEAIIKGKEEYGGGWLCWKKRDGCGAKFQEGNKEIESQAAGKVINEDIATLKNTVLKMAKKRAKVDATLAATRSSGIFTQDMEDIQQPVDDTNGAGSKKAAQEVAARKIAEAGPRQSAPTPAPRPAKKPVKVTHSSDGRTMYVNGDAFEIESAIKERGGKLNKTLLLWEITGGENMVAVLKACADKGLPIQEFQLEQKKEAKPSQISTGIIQSVLRRKNDKKQEYLVLTQNGRKLVLWDNKTLDYGVRKAKAFDVLELAIGQEGTFHTETRGEYTHITGASKIGSQVWDDDGTPVLQRAGTDEEPPLPEQPYA